MPEGCENVDPNGTCTQWCACMALQAPKLASLLHAVITWAPLTAPPVCVAASVAFFSHLPKHACTVQTIATAASLQTNVAGELPLAGWRLLAGGCPALPASQTSPPTPRSGQCLGAWRSSVSVTPVPQLRQLWLGIVRPHPEVARLACVVTQAVLPARMRRPAARGARSAHRIPSAWSQADAGVETPPAALTARVMSIIANFAGTPSMLSTQGLAAARTLPGHSPANRALGWWLVSIAAAVPAPP